MLTKIRDAAITKDLSENELNDKIKVIFPDKEAFLQGQENLMRDLFPDDFKDDK